MCFSECLEELANSEYLNQMHPNKKWWRSFDMTQKTHVGMTDWIYCILNTNNMKALINTKYLPRIQQSMCRRYIKPVFYLLLLFHSKPYWHVYVMHLFSNEQMINRALMVKPLRILQECDGFKRLIFQEFFFVSQHKLQWYILCNVEDKIQKLKQKKSFFETI